MTKVIGRSDCYQSSPMKEEVRKWQCDGGEEQIGVVKGPRF